MTVSPDLSIAVKRLPAGAVMIHGSGVSAFREQELQKKYKNINTIVVPDNHILRGAFFIFLMDSCKQAWKLSRPVFEIIVFTGLIPAKDLLQIRVEKYLGFGDRPVVVFGFQEGASLLDPLHITRIAVLQVEVRITVLQSYPVIP